MEEELQKHPLNQSTCLEEELETSVRVPAPPLSSICFDIELPLGTIASSSATEPFRLEQAVCSHGLFMMAPNHWDPLSNTLTRPLLLLPDEDNPSSSSLIVSVSQRPTSLNIRVHGAQSLSPPQERALLAQVSRMLRLSEIEEKAVREFRSMSIDHQNRSFGGRVFRSPTLFEDMVKCVLLCNCQWPRTLSMAQALCELQFELQNGSFASSGNPKVETEGFIPKTPAAKETRRKRKNSSGVSKKGTSLKKKLELEVDGDMQMDLVLASKSNSDATLPRTDIYCNACQAEEEFGSDDSCLHLTNGREYFDYTGNFPSPSELANLDENFLAKRCKLGYRAGRIVELARAIVDGKLRLKELEELSKDANLSSYKQLEDHLKQVKGFGPFTCANVLMCMGYYHVIPTDSETVRHLKQVHSRKSTTQTIMSDVEEIYGKFKPYQFLAYWSEIWDFYERRFGKMNEMHSSHYKLITASNMRSNGKDTNKSKRSSERNIDEAHQEIGPREPLVHKGGNNPKVWKVYIGKRKRATTPIAYVA